ncbi:MAG TPA: hypothetical protein VN154_09100, partial [Rhizomicrobium sp.]|nr:hypothetical protein [Rhizomicrobium sp.]
RLVETPTVYHPVLQDTVGRLASHGLTRAQGYGTIMGKLINQAYLLSSIDLFWLSAWSSLAMLGIVWLARRSIPSGRVVASE